MEIQIRSTNDLGNAAKQLLEFSPNERIFLFEGDMGAGKTTFIKAICEELGVEDATSSPTYSIVNEYKYTGGKVFHFDFFRIKNEAEAYDIGFEEYLYSGNYCFIEWPERIRSLWPSNYTEVTINQLEAQRRIINLGRV